MPIITFDYQDFLFLLNHRISKDDLVQKLPMIGADFDAIDGDKLSVEFFPNRPDLTSVEGIARAARAFFGFQPGLQSYEVKKSDIQITVDPSVKKVRPFVTTAIVKQIKMTDELIISLMDMQEKLHSGLGRNRKKVAIGVHNLEPLTPPFTYKAVDPKSVSFVPLAKTESMTLDQILRHHEKGVDYAFILDGCEKYPLIVDAQGNVLSFPPIINGSLTEVTSSTTDLFIDVTGTDRKAINSALNILTTALAERGGHIYSTIVHDGAQSFVTPDLTPLQKTLTVQGVERVLGIHLSEQDIIKNLEKMGYSSTIQEPGVLFVQIPSWRADILHEVDLIEDVAIGFGFDLLQSDLPRALTFGKPLKNQSLYEALRAICIGLGFNEATSFTISNEEVEFHNMGFESGELVTLENPIGEEYSCLRVSLLPSLLALLKENKHHSLPQQMFELGFVVDGKGKNHRNLGMIKIDAKANYSLCKSLVEAVLRDSGIGFSLAEANHPAFIPGRCATVIKDKTIIGIFGELHPRTITAFKLEHPIIAIELFVDLLHP